MNWIVTADGHEASLEFPTHADYEIERIAHSLAQINRFNGHAARPYSVAEHSLLVLDIAKTKLGLDAHGQMAALMHDAHEAYVTDLSSPAKTAVDEYSMGAGGIAAWRCFEANNAKALHTHFGILTLMRSNRLMVRAFDLQALATERRDLTGYDASKNAPWPILADVTDRPVLAVDWVNLNSPEREAKSWKDWREDFAERYLSLEAQMRAEFARQVC